MGCGKMILGHWLMDRPKSFWDPGPFPRHTAVVPSILGAGFYSQILETRQLNLIPKIP